MRTGQCAPRAKAFFTLLLILRPFARCVPKNSLCFQWCQSCKMRDGWIAQRHQLPSKVWSMLGFNLMDIISITRFIWKQPMIAIVWFSMRGFVSPCSRHSGRSSLRLHGSMITCLHCWSLLRFNILNESLYSFCERWQTRSAMGKQVDDKLWRISSMLVSPEFPGQEFTRRWGALRSLATQMLQASSRKAHEKSKNEEQNKKACKATTEWIEIER